MLYSLNKFTPEEVVCNLGLKIKKLGKSRVI